VALFTDYVFADPLALGYSLAVLAGTAGPLSALVIATGLRHYRSSTERLARMTAAA
jgi:hypothetical protein